MDDDKEFPVTISSQNYQIFSTFAKYAPLRNINITTVVSVM